MSRNGALLVASARFRPVGLFGPWVALAPGAAFGRAEPVAPRAGLDDVGVEGDPVDDGRHEPGVGDYAAPFTEREVRSQGDRRPLFSFRQDLEQEL
jgi:hypothetical protein